MKYPMRQERPRGSLHLAATLLVAASYALDTSAQQADFSGLDPFWAVAEMIAAGREPPESAWAALFATPGYRTLKERDNADAFFARLLPLALSPAREAAAREAMAAQPLGGMFITHLRAAFERRQDLEALRSELEGRPLADGALIEAQKWLPENAAARFGAPAISFVIYQPDARGYDRIIMDLLLALERPALFEGLLAHEAHHVLRSKMQRFRSWGDLPEANLLRALDNLQAEGIADQIDRPVMLSIEDWGERSTDRAFKLLIDRFRDELDQVQQRLAEVDRILAEYAAEPGAAVELGKRLRKTLVMGGHPVGYHMANRIVSAGGRQRMVDNVADPFEFVRAYNEAAATESAKHHVLSAEALRGLEQLGRILLREGNQE